MALVRVDVFWAVVESCAWYVWQHSDGRNCHCESCVAAPVDIGPVAKRAVGRGRQEQLDFLVVEWAGEPLLASGKQEGAGTALD